jgi:hypothetical protein
MFATMKSVLPQRSVDPQRRHLRDLLIEPDKQKPSVGLLALCLLGGIVFASAVLLTTEKLRSSTAPSSSQETIVAQEPSTDGRATPDMDDDAFASTTHTPPSIVTRLSENCAAHARETLMVGLTHYYLHRRLRPGASSDDAAEISSLTGVLSGPGDPVAMTPGTSCHG